MVPEENSGRVVPGASEEPAPIASTFDPPIETPAALSEPQPDLLQLGTYIARHQVAIAFGDKKEALQSRAVIAGLLAAAKVFLPPRAFKQFVIGNEIDPTQLEALLELAHAEPEE
jgi:hypothetical protein